MTDTTGAAWEPTRMLYYIFGGCIAIYLGAYLLRWVVKGYVKLTGASPAPHNVRYATIGAATALLMLLAAIGESRLSAPDYSYLWTYLMSGAVVFALSVGHSYWRWKRAQRAEFEGTGELAGIDPWGHERPHSHARDGDEESTLEEIIFIVGFALMMAGVLAVSAYDVEPEALIGLMLTPFLWLGEGFVTAITNPYYLGGLVVGIGTGWILGRSWPKKRDR